LVTGIPGDQFTEIMMMRILIITASLIVYLIQPGLVAEPTHLAAESHLTQLAAMNQLAGSAAIASAVISTNWPANTTDRRTTSEAIYLGNLDSSIGQLEQLTKGKSWSERHRLLVDQLYHRYRIIGNISDLERVMNMLLPLQHQQPLVFGDQIVLTRVLVGVHRFQQAQTILQRLQPTTPAQQAELTAVASEIAAAVGQYADIQTSIKSASNDINAIVLQASLLVDQGQLLQASLKLKQAQFAYQDVNPYLLAWLHVQQGIAFLRYEDLDSAEVFFKAAHQRMPHYYLATEHLAEVRLRKGDYAGAAELYRQVSIQTQNPEFFAQLAVVETALGHQQAAHRASERAAKDYVRLINDYPAMMADHGAGYFLDQGQNQKALQLAQQNIGLRQSVSAWLLLAEAAIANQSTEMACDALHQLQQINRQPPESLLLQAELSCDT